MTLLFDLDGTLVDSSAVVMRHWRRWCDRHGIALESVLAVAHGIRTSDAIARIAPELDSHAEAAALDAVEEHDTEGLVPVVGAARLLATLGADSWAVVTSGHRSLATRRLRAVGLPVPRVMVCGDEVERGKPDPEGYLAAARLIGVRAAACVVLEDAPAGIEAGRAAGMRVVAVTTTHAAAELTHAHAIVDNLEPGPALDAALYGA